MKKLLAWLLGDRRHIGSESVELKIGRRMWREITTRLQDFSDGEQGAFIFCSQSRRDGMDVLLARDWIEIPVEDSHRRDGYGLSWSSEFSGRVLQKAKKLKAGVVLIHSHGDTECPALSPQDTKSAKEMFPAFSRVAGFPCGSVVLGDTSAAGTFWKAGKAYAELSQIRVVGQPITCVRNPKTRGKQFVPRMRNDRTRSALGSESEKQLASASVAVIGLCGGGSHVCQQSAHAGVGRITLIDADVVEATNLGRMVGSNHGDIGQLKAKVIRRLIKGIDPQISVQPIAEKFPSPRTIEAIKHADVVIACVDSFLVREQINAFCRRHHIPLIDIGLTIRTESDSLVRASGQVMLVTPDSACLRCGPFLSDEVLAEERRLKPPGYDQNADAKGAPQVVSMNGVIASEAINLVLDLVTGYSGGCRPNGWWQYDGRRGSLKPLNSPIARRPGCPACAEQGLGDPQY